jgi:uncharacterized membrane protein YphA (DoxX/SURF4 family)
MAIAGRACIGLVFLLAAVQKLRHWRLLPGVIANYRLLPPWAVGITATVLPLAEMLLAIALLSGREGKWPALAGIALLLLFAAAMAINVRRGRKHIDCGCGQKFLAQHLSWALAMRNLVLAVMLLPSLARLGPVSISEIWTGAAAGLGFFLLYLLFNLFSALPPVQTGTGARRFA